MKIESIADILKILKPALTAKTMLYTALVVAVASWVSFLFPQVFAFLKLDAWRANNDALIGLAIIASSITLLIVFLVKLDSWISASLSRGQDKRFVRRLCRHLNDRELEYLYQFIQHRTTAIVFNETDPDVQSLRAKGIIRLSARPALGQFPSYESQFGHGGLFVIPPEIYRYLDAHRELFRRDSAQGEGIGISPWPKS